MQLKIEGRNKLGQLKMVLLHADTITDNEVRNALQMVGFTLSTRHDPMDGHDVLADIGEKERHGKYITHADLAFEKEQAACRGWDNGYQEGYSKGKAEVEKTIKPCRRKHVTDGALKDARKHGYNEGWDAHRAHAEQQTAAVPPGYSVISYKELADRINQAYERGKADCKVETPQTFPIPADVWNGKHYGEFVSLSGFAPDSIPGASQHGYDYRYMYVLKEDLTRPGHYMKSPMVTPPCFSPDNAESVKMAQESHNDLLEDGYVPSLIIKLR